MCQKTRHPLILLDTDIGCDCDDAGAMAVLHALADMGETEILAVTHTHLHAGRTGLRRQNQPVLRSAGHSDRGAGRGYLSGGQTV